MLIRFFSKCAMLILFRGLCLWVVLGVVLYSNCRAETLPRKMTEALELLKASPRGRVLVARAVAVSKTGEAKGLLSLMKWGDSSRTDTTLTRQFNPQTGREERFRKLVIYLKQDQALIELALDLAHELVHATSKPSYDPYDPMLTPAKYIYLAIEGLGGEVDAVYTECEIGIQLSQLKGLNLERCKRYLNNSDLPGAIDRTKILKGFYRVGNWRSFLIRELGEEISLFPSLSSDRAVLFSSTGHSPYPVALYQEYEEITQAACENSVKRRASIFSSSSAPSTSASSKVGGLFFSTPAQAGSEQAHEDLDRFMRKRCHFSQ